MPIQDMKMTKMKMPKISKFNLSKLLDAFGCGCSLYALLADCKRPYGFS